MSVVTVPSRTIRLPLNISTLANAFFSIGLALLVADAFLYRELTALAATPYSTRAVIGFHLFPSEIWFLGVGNALLLGLLARDRFVVPLHLVENARPILAVVGIYLVWLFYGALFGNGWAIQEFREMVFHALSLPAILYLAPHLDLRRLFERWFVPLVSLAVVAAVLARYAHNSLLILATLALAFHLFRALYGRKSAFVLVAVVAGAFVLKFSKPMLALLLFILAFTAMVAAHLNPESVRWVLSRFKLRIVAITLIVLTLLVALAVAANIYYDGLIEYAIRYFILKERITDAGEVTQGNLAGGRFAIWTSALMAWTERPLIGYGLGASVETYSAGWVTKVQFHNYPIQTLHNTGLFGFLLLAAAWTVWFRRTLRALRRAAMTPLGPTAAAMFIFVLGIFAYGLYGHALSFTPCAQLFWICVGFLTVLQGDRRGRA